MPRRIINNWKITKGVPLTELDKKVLYFQNHGCLVPKRELIKTPEQIEGIRRSGIVNTGVLDLVEKEIRAGMSTAEIDRLVYDYTVSHRAIPAPLNYEGFPKSVCTSINEVVCHGIPSEDEILKEGDIINVDVSTILDGYYSDASRMFIIGKTTPEKEKLVRITKECLEIGSQAVRVRRRYRKRHTTTRREKRILGRSRFVRTRGRPCFPRRTRSPPFRQERHGYVARTGNGLHHRTHDKYGGLARLHRRRRRLDSRQRRRITFGSMGAYVPHDRKRPRNIDILIYSLL